jgi:hypothetical protein
MQYKLLNIENDVDISVKIVNFDTLQLVSQNFSPNVANFLPKFVAKFKGSLNHIHKPFVNNELRWLLLVQGPIRCCMFATGFVNFNMNF